MSHDTETCVADNIAEKAIADTVSMIVAEEFAKFAKGLSTTPEDVLRRAAQMTGEAIRNGYDAYHRRGPSDGSASLADRVRMAEAVSLLNRMADASPDLADVFARRMTTPILNQKDRWSTMRPAGLYADGVTVLEFLNHLFADTGLCIEFASPRDPDSPPSFSLVRPVETVFERAATKEADAHV